MVADAVADLKGVSGFMRVTEQAESMWVSALAWHSVLCKYRRMSQYRRKEGRRRHDVMGEGLNRVELCDYTWGSLLFTTVHSHKPHFIAVHCQEVGGKNCETSMAHVDSFIKELLSSDGLKEYSRARVYLDENYESKELFTVSTSTKNNI
ncbi:unnamed protein product [Arctogadus glacialis]